MDDEYVQLASTVVSSISLSSLPGKFWVEYFPILRHLPSWIPGTYFKKYAEGNRPASLKLLNQPFDEMKEKLVLNRMKSLFGLI